MGSQTHAQTHPGQPFVKTSTVPAIVFAVLLTAATHAAETYNPLAFSGSASREPLELTVTDQTRQRNIPIRVYLPPSKGACPVVLFSHGLGGTRDGCVYLGNHWSARGYIGIFLQHPGSDDSVWKDEPRQNRMVAMRKAASGSNLVLRVQDVHAVLDQLEIWNRETGHLLNGRLDVTRIGMSGHSFGAVTTQWVSGQVAGRLGGRFTDDRVSAAIAFSPSTPQFGNPATAFGSVKIPWMLMTGTKDTAPIGHADVPARLNVYPNLPESIDKYELVLHNAEHSAFTDRGLPGDTEKRNPNHHRAILALSTAFWDTYLRGDNEAREWLQGQGPRSVLEEEDRWQFNAAH